MAMFGLEIKGITRCEQDDYGRLLIWIQSEKVWEEENKFNYKIRSKAEISGVT